MKNNEPYIIKSISEFHTLRGLASPKHPLISVVDVRNIPNIEPGNNSWILNFYCVSLKRTKGIKYQYGQLEYDFQNGTMFFMRPGQVFSFTKENYIAQSSGWMLLIHHDFLWNTALGHDIEQYDFFDYKTNEALFVSDHEELILTSIINNIRQEHAANIDKFTKGVIIAQITSLLTYADRFYDRQFITREKANNQILDRLNKTINELFMEEDLLRNGIPSVSSVSDAMHVSPSYLSRLLRHSTGRSTQQFIHDKLILKAREMLANESLSISQIAYQLGFEHPQSFTKLFKTKTKMSPIQFRRSLN